MHIALSLHAAAAPIAGTVLMVALAGSASAGPPPAAFARCAACHAAAPGAPARVGPDLWGVYGARAGARPGFAYSAALKTSGVVWTRATLGAWLVDDQKIAPGTTMPNLPLADGERAAIVGYLASLR